MDIKKLNEERKRQKITVAELAKRASLPKATVEKILFGIVQNPRIDTMYAIERALGIESEITPQEYAAGARYTKKVGITADEEDVLDKAREVIDVLGEKGKDLIIEFCDILLTKIPK